MEPGASAVSDYVRIFRRRLQPLAGSAFVILLGFIALAYALPASYYSSGTILIEQQDVPQELVRSTVTTYAEERIQIVSQRVMTSATLAEIINKYDLYPEDREAGASMAERVDLFRSDTTLDTLSAQVDARTHTTIAFTVGYTSSSADLAKQVATDLVNLYMQENARSRTEAATETSEFLSKRAQQLDSDLKTLEQAIADFKAKHGESLPELLRLNTDRLEATDIQISNAEREVRTIRDNIAILESELAVMSPFAAYDESGDGLMTAPRRLDALQREYITLSSRYGPKHPDLIRVRKEIELLTGGSVRADLEAIEEQLYALRIELQTKRQNYSGSHPDIVNLENAITDLERRRSDVLEISSANIEPTNPLYIQRKGALAAARNELAAAQKGLRELQAKLANYERRLSLSPEVERDYTAMMREYEAKLLQFREIDDKRETALLAESLEIEQKGERFILIDPPTLPADPISPNRTAIILLGVVLAAGAGMGLAVLLDSLDSTVRGSSDIVELFGGPPLAAVMYVKSSADAARQRLTAALYAGSALAGIVLVILIAQLAG